MGDAEIEDAPPFEVEIRSFYIGKAPITNAQFEAFDPAHRRAVCSPHDDDPAVQVTFHEAQAYCRWYSEISGKAFRLPTEAEWEFAGRGGCTDRYPWGTEANDSSGYAWTRKNSDRRCHAIEGLKANGHGLYDMIGNTWEWTSSSYQPYPLGHDRQESPQHAPSRVVRGGSFRSDIGTLSTALRRPLKEDCMDDDLGFRIVRTL